MDPAVLHKYGQLIKTVPHLTSFEQVRALQHPKVDTIQSLNISFGDDQLYRELVADLVRRCKGLFGSPSVLFRPPNAKLFKVVVLDYNPAFELIRESSVTSLEAPLGEIWMPDAEDSSAPPFLAHLPLLKEWKFTSLDRAANWNIDTAHQKIAEYCPFLNTLGFGEAATENISELLINCFQLVESCTLTAKNLEVMTTVACINHMQTMTSITITDELPPVANHPDMMKWVYFIPKLCLHLQYLSIEKLVLDMDTVQKHQWSCHDLKELRVKFRGLESEEDIERCVMEVCA
ncbi:hypothetical protein BGZ96_007684 [Linnemannia gamsii]|uniref:Uncharacterized protein n=1 Tax=Linnemannia gamsii TaxID=64522 RepID=A0ABQ7K111_9FUNG|nr:hypothetical protein BGZ96_007684 [Linnemannia gamsii]